MHQQKTRIFRELVVGGTHTVEVLIQLRRQDTTWFHSSPQNEEELIALLGDTVFQKHFVKEIEAYHEKRKPKCTTPVEVGEKNLPLAKRVDKKRKKGKKDPQQEPPSEKPKRDVNHAFSENIKITFRLQEIMMYESATLIVQKGETKDLQVRQLAKLPRRVILWCYPREENSDPTDPDPEDSRFPRPEHIPIGSLFRQKIPDVNDIT